MELIDEADTMSLDGRSGGAVFESVRGTRLEREIVYAGVFPNLLLSLHPDYVMTHRMEPVAPDRTIVGECQWLFAPDWWPGPTSTRHAVDFWDLTNRQDWARSRACSGACARPAGCRGGSPSSRTTCGASPTSSLTGYLGRDVTTIGGWDDLDTDRPARGATA